MNGAWNIDVTKGLTAAAIVACGLCALLAYATPYGLGVGGDATVYISAARRLAAGDGLTFLNNVNEPQALTQFPPLYPLLLAAGEAAGLGVLATGKLLALLSIAMAGGCTALLCYMRTRSLVVALLAGVLLAACSQLVHVHAQFMTEGPFIGLTMLALLLTAGYQLRGGGEGRGGGGADRGRAWPWLIAIGLVVVSAILFRFAAVSLAGAVALAMLLGGPGSCRDGWRDGWRGRVLGAVVALGAAGVAMGLLALRNRLLGAAPAGRNTGYVPLTPEWIDTFLLTLSGAVMPDNDLRWLGNGVVLLLGIGFVLVPVLRWAGRRPGQVGGDAGRVVDKVCWTFVLIYLPFLIICRIFVDAAIPSTYRLLAPAYIPMQILVVGAVSDLVLDRNFGRRLAARHFELPALRWAPVLVVAWLAWLGLEQTTAWAQGGRTRGFGYMSAAWRTSPTLAEVAKLPANTPIYSDGADAIQFLLGRESNGLPLVRFRTSGKVNPVLAQDLERIRLRLEADGGVVVYFKTIRRGDFLLSEEAAVEAFDLELLAEHADGRLWRRRDE